MRSRKSFTQSLSASEVNAHAKEWVQPHLKIEGTQRKCTESVILGILLIAASRMCSLFAACRDLAAAPSDQALRNALDATLPDVVELERRINAGLATPIPKRVFRKKRDAAIDLTLIPYHGQPHEHESELYHSLAKSGTTKFHAWATLCITERGFRYTIAVTRVTGGEKLVDVLRRLLRQAADRGLKIRLLQLDRGFFCTAVIAELKQTQTPFLMPVMFRGRKPKDPKKVEQSLRRFQKKPSGWYRATVSGEAGEQHIHVCVSAKYYVHEKTGKRRLKRLIFASGGWRQGQPSDVRERYRCRFGIETSYRQMHESRIRTTHRNPVYRLLFVGLALILRNVWVWLHYARLADTRGENPDLRLDLLRFRQMLEWIAQVERHTLHNGALPEIVWNPNNLP